MLIGLVPVRGDADLWQIPFREERKFIKGRVRYALIGENFHDKSLPGSVLRALRGTVVRVVLTAEYLFEQTGDVFRNEIPAGACLGYAKDFAQRLTDIGHFQAGKLLRSQSGRLDMIILPAGQFAYVPEPKV